MKTVSQLKIFTPSPKKHPTHQKQNPQQILSTNIHKPSELSIDSRFDTQMIRIKVQHHSRLVQTLFQIAVMMAYEALPYSPINIKELIDSSFCKLIKSSSSKIYLGETQNKKKHGKGVAIYKDGRIYEGNFLENEKNGFGVQVYSNGNIYFGNFHQNKKHGKGVFFWFSLSEIPCTKNAQIVIEHYKGTWWGGLPDGKGQHIRSNGDIYIGEFKNGLKHGKGMQTYSNGDFYEGQFINGLCQGNGTYLWKDGSQYNGDFKQGYRNGYGIWNNKHKDQTYQGHYMLDKKHGYGMYLWGNGYTYKGNYIEDERNGEGKLMYQDEVIYEGIWVNGQKADEPSFYHKKSKSFSANKSHHSALTKSTNLQHQMKKYPIRSPLSSSKQRSVQKQKTFQSTSNQQKPKSLAKTFTQMPKMRQDTYCVSFKYEEEKKQRVGHRNCIPCRQLKQMREKSRSMKKEQKNHSRSLHKR